MNETEEGTAPAAMQRPVGAKFGPFVDRAQYMQAALAAVLWAGCEQLGSRPQAARLSGVHPSTVQRVVHGKCACSWQSAELLWQAISAHAEIPTPAPLSRYVSAVMARSTRHLQVPDRSRAVEGLRREAQTLLLTGRF